MHVRTQEFCGAAGPSPAPPTPTSTLPALGTTVLLEPSSMSGLAFRHCEFQGYVTPASASGNDHLFKMVSALSSTPYAVSFESVNYPGYYITTGAGATRPSIVKAPAALDASWLVTPAGLDGFNLTSISPAHHGKALAVAPFLNGTCAGSYTPPSRAAMVSSTASVWRIVPASGGGGTYPRRAACVVQTLYDQTGRHNHLLPATPAINNPSFDNPVNATRHPVSVGGHTVYGAYFETGMGYRAQNTSGVARGNDPETIYMVTSGTHINGGCCFDYGNSENDCDNPTAFCDGCMEAVYMGSGYGGGGKGPWIGADLENGIYGGPFVNNSFLHSDFVTAMVKGGVNGFTVKGGNASSGKLTTLFDGPRPHGYQPMHKAGAIILGVGGDNAARLWNTQDESESGAATGWPRVGIPGLSIGTFYEGVLTAGYSTDAADDAVQANIVAMGYGAR